MYELRQVGERTYYINCPARMGLYRANDADVYLIDSGSDKDAGKKVKKLLAANGWTLRAIFNTHSHADHIGGNRVLQQATGCKIYARGIEAAFARHPILEPVSLYGGDPPQDLRHKFLLAAESEVCELTEDVLPEGLSLIELPGHSFDMVGFRTSDDVVFLADCVCSEQTLEKYQISFLFDVGQYLETLDRVDRLEAALFIPAHAEPTASIRPLTARNREKVQQIAADLLTLTETPKCFEQLLKEVFDAYALTMSFEQYVLVGSTVRSYLAWLRRSGKLDVRLTDNRLLWQRSQI